MTDALPLIAYLGLLRRYWLLVLLLPILVAALSLGLAVRRPPLYAASTHLLVTQSSSADPAIPLPALDEGATWVTTEYLLDDLPAVLTSVAFANDVNTLLAAEGYNLDPGAIRAGLRPEVTHRSLRLTATATSPELAHALARNAIVALQEGGLKYWGRAPAGGLAVAVLDPPGTAVPVASLRALILEVGLRTALALAAGLGLAFAAHALDDRLRSARQAEQWIGAQVLAVIPDEPRR
ncbi:MAG: lipopolysaccharide biosynthesis protein [Oscillochloridaceae bacterium umkhey_bin13]